ncbi:hypothetical protein [Methylobacterium nigriterrae]
MVDDLARFPLLRVFHTGLNRRAQDAQAWRLSVAAMGFRSRAASD